MSVHTIKVEVQPDHLETMSRVRKPILAIAELIWNGLDAESTDVRVMVELNEIEGIDCIRIQDNGHGLPFEEADDAFGRLGGSWKRESIKTAKKKRILHGRLGKGRFRAFAIGGLVSWVTRYRENGKQLSYTISGTAEDFGTFKISSPEPTSVRHSGTEVEIRNLYKNYTSLLPDSAVPELAQYFALYLLQYSEAKIHYDGRRIDPFTMIDRRSEPRHYEFEIHGKQKVSASLSVIEWKHPVERTLVLCDADGFALAEKPPGIHAPGFNFTAYLGSTYLKEIDEQGALQMDEMHPGLAVLLDGAREGLRDYFRSRSAESAQVKVEAWKKDNVYPFEGEAKTVIDRAKRQVFDVCALSVSEYLPEFESSARKTKKLTLSLIKQAVESGPEALQSILRSVLDLPRTKQDELAELLARTTLSSIISASKIVADRLNFLKALEILLFDPDMKEKLLERKQLHRIVADHTWIFGEEFHLSADDESLTTVLKRHLHLLGDETEILEPVRRDDGSAGVVDLMLSRRIPQPDPARLEHLVVELKRPAVSIGETEIAQVKSYARAVAKDERFKSVDVKWTFWALSNDLTEAAKMEASQSNRPAGLVFEGGNTRIWVREWSQIIHDCAARLEFYRKSLEYNADRDSAVDYLRKKHEQYLPSGITVKN